MSALSEIKARLEKEPDNLNMLNLEGIKIGTITEDIKQYLERFKKVKVLILRQCELTSLDNLPPWKLAAIDLSENKFKDNIIEKLAGISGLTQILLMENEIESLENLKQLSILKHLQELDFTGCPVSTEPNYRPILFDSIKSLEILDQMNLNGQYVAEDEDEDDESEFDGDEEAASDEEDYEQEEEEESSEKPKGGRGKKK